MPNVAVKFDEGTIDNSKEFPLFALMTRVLIQSLCPILKSELMFGNIERIDSGEKFSYWIDGMLAFSTSAATVGLRFGMSVAPLSTPRLFSFTRMSGAQSATGAGAGGVMQVSGSSVLLSLGTFGVALVANPVTVKAMFNVASAGTVTFQYAGIASTAASPIHVLPGSYFKAFRIK
jgi:hypothetical protein